MKFYYCEENGNMLTLETEKQPLKCMINWSKSISEAINKQSKNLQVDLDVANDKVINKSNALKLFNEAIKNNEQIKLC